MPFKTNTTYVVTTLNGDTIAEGFKNLPEARAVARKIASGRNGQSAQVVRSQRQIQFVATVQNRPDPVETTTPRDP